MTDIADALNLSAIEDHRRRRTVAVLELLHRGRPQTLPGTKDLPMAYGLAHHRLEAAENAARRGDTAALHWHQNEAAVVLPNLVRHSRLGPRIVVAPTETDMIRSPHSATPYYLLGPSTTSASDTLINMTESATDHISSTGLDSMTTAHAAVVCLTGRRRPDQTLRSFAITRLPATVFTDHTGDPSVLGRDLVHEAAHNWLNDALTALRVAIPEDVVYFSPWRRTDRPAFGFLHACFAFPLTVIYAHRALPAAAGSGRTILIDHVRQQRLHLEAVQADFARAVRLISDPGLRERLRAVFEHALLLPTL